MDRRVCRGSASTNRTHRLGVPVATRRRGLHDSATAAGKAQSTAGGPKLLLTVRVLEELGYM